MDIQIDPQTQQKLGQLWLVANTLLSNGATIRHDPDGESYYALNQEVTIIDRRYGLQFQCDAIDLDHGRLQLSKANTYDDWRSYSVGADFDLSIGTQDDKWTRICGF